MALSKVQQDAVKMSFEKIMANADSFAKIFYGHLFDGNESIKTLFKISIHEQGQLLVRMLGISVGGLDHPGELLPALRDMGLYHAGYGVKPEYYEIFGAALLRTLKEFLGADFTPEVHDAWTAFYQFLSSEALAGAREAS